MIGGYYTVCGHCVIMQLDNHNINITIDCNNMNITVAKDCSLINKEKENFGPQLSSALDHFDLTKLDFLEILESYGLVDILLLTRRFNQRRANLSINFSFVAFLSVQKRIKLVWTTKGVNYMALEVKYFNDLE